MKPGSTKKANMLLGLGIVMMPAIIGSVIMVPALATHFWVLSLLIILAQASFIGGCCFYAGGKGYHPALGLLGLLSLPGLVVLAVLKDKHKGEDTAGGCLPALLVIFLALLFILGPVIFWGTRLAKRVGGDGRQRLDQTMAKVSVAVLESGSADLGANMKAVDTLINNGSDESQAALRAFHRRLKTKSAPTSDDRVLIRRLDDHFAVAQAAATPDIPVGVPADIAPAADQPPPPPSAASSVSVKAFLKSTGHPTGTAGFLYVDLDGDRRADRAVRVRDDKTWQVAEASGPGVFNTVRADGAIAANGVLVNFPGDVFSGAKKIWVAGDITAFIGPDKVGPLAPQRPAKR